MVKGERLTVCVGDHFDMVLPDGSMLNVEQTQDDFSIVTMDGQCVHTQPTSDAAKAEDAVEIQEVNNDIDRLKRVIQQLLDDYRTEGCANTACTVCQKSRAAEDAAKAALMTPSEQVEEVLRGRR